MGENEERAVAYDDFSECVATEGNRLESIVREEHEATRRAVDAAKLSILRGFFSGDKTAELLEGLHAAVRRTCMHSHWLCPVCGVKKPISPPEVTPMCVHQGVDVPMTASGPEERIFDTDEWKAAEAYVLRIKFVKDSKEKAKGDE